MAQAGHTSTLNASSGKPGAMPSAACRFGTRPISTSTGSTSISVNGITISGVSR